jgi:hypothetical protein
MASPSPRSGFNWPHVLLIARFGARFALRTGGGLIFLLIVILVGLGVAAMFISPVETLIEGVEGGRRQTEERGTGEVIDEIIRSEPVQNVVGWLTGGDKEEVAYLLEKNPALLSTIVLLLVLLFPYVTCFGAFNQTSGDIQNKGLRYLLLRTERPNIYVGRLVGTTLFALVNTIVLMAILVLYIGLKLRVYPAGDLLVWGLQGVLALGFVALPYVALCAWISALIDSPFGALVLCLLLVGFPVLFLGQLARAAKWDAETVLRVLPWGWKYDLLASDPGTRLLAFAVMAAFTAVFLWLGLRHFQKRDL